MKVTDQPVSQKNVFTDVPAFNESRLMGTHQLIKHFPKSIRQNFWDFLYKHVAQWDSLKDTSGLSTLGVSSRKVELTHFNCFTLRKKFETALHTSCLMIPQQTWKKKWVGIESVGTGGFLLHISNLPVVPALSRKLTARSCSAASLGDVPLTGFRTQPSSEPYATK